MATVRTNTMFQDGDHPAPHSEDAPGPRGLDSSSESSPSIKPSIGAVPPEVLLDIFQAYILDCRKAYKSSSGQSGPYAWSDSSTFAATGGTSPSAKLGSGHGWWLPSIPSAQSSLSPTLASSPSPSISRASTALKNNSCRPRCG